MIRCSNTLVSEDCEVEFPPDLSGGIKATYAEGETSLAIGQVAVTVIFSTPLTKSDFVFEEAYIENLVDPNPAVIGWVPTAKSATGFTVRLDPAPATANYVFRWKVKVT